MASSHVETQITWSAAASITLSAATQTDSDTFSLNDETWEASIEISADNAGTPAAGDVVDVYLKRSTGDVLGDTGDDYETNEHAMFLCRLDTVAANTPGEDPARRVIDIPTSAKKVRLSVVAPQAASRNIVVRARINEHRIA